MVVLDHQTWRLFTSVFLHSGIVHILMNMYCLFAIGPLVERLLGHFAFAFLYVLSGVGGEIATLVWANPMSVSIGASGAIFGVLGGLLGYLAIRRHEVPVVALRHLRTTALMTVVFSTLYSLSVPGINTACASRRSGHRSGERPALHRARPSALESPSSSGTGRAPDTGLGVAGGRAHGNRSHWIDRARGRILSDPRLGPLLDRPGQPGGRMNR